MTNENENMVIDIPKVRLEQAVAITLSFHRLGSQRDGDMDEVETSCEKSMGRFVKKLFGGKEDGESKCKEYDAIVSYDNKLYRWLCDQSVSLMGRRNVRLVGRDAVNKIETTLAKAVKERQLLVDAFLIVYPLVIEAAKTKLNGQYDEGDYPSVERVATKFSIDWNYLALGVPENLPAEVRAAMSEKVTKMWEQAGEQIRDGLRIGFVKLVEHLITKLQPASDGKKQKFYDSNVTNILDFIDTLAQRDLTGDIALQQVAKQAKELIETHAKDIDKVKTDASTKAAVVQGMAAIKASCDAMIGSEKRRKFDLE